MCDGVCMVRKRGAGLNLILLKVLVNFTVRVCFHHQRRWPTYKHQNASYNFLVQRTHTHALQKRLTLCKRIFFQCNYVILCFFLFFRSAFFILNILECVFCIHFIRMLQHSISYIAQLVLKTHQIRADFPSKWIERRRRFDRLIGRLYPSISQ